MKALAIGAAVVILLVIVAMVIVGGEHGPLRHTPTGAAGQASPTVQGAQLQEATMHDRLVVG